MELNRYLEAAKVQGFDWSITEYKVDSVDTEDAGEDENEHSEPEIVCPQNR